MPITVEVVDPQAAEKDIDKVFLYFEVVDKKFSTFRKDSEISLINDKRLMIDESSKDMQTIFKLAGQTKRETNGYFDIRRANKYDPLGLVKGWAILNAARILDESGFKNYFIEAGGDIQVSGKNNQGESWKVGIRNPFNTEQIVKVVRLSHEGIATSGTYLRGKHIYNPKNQFKPADEIASMTVIGPNIYEADRFATATFVIGKEGINFIEAQLNLEGYMIDKEGVATMTSGFDKYAV